MNILEIPLIKYNDKNIENRLIYIDSSQKIGILREEFKNFIINLNYKINKYNLWVDNDLFLYYKKERIYTNPIDFEVRKENIYIIINIDEVMNYLEENKIVNIQIIKEKK